MSAQSPRRRKSAAAQMSRPVKTSVPLDVGTHAKLAAMAALRGMPAGALAAEFIRDGVRSIIVIDKARKANHEGSVDPDAEINRTDAARV